MSSRVVIQDKRHSGSYSQMAVAIQQLAGQINTEAKGLYDQKVKVTINRLEITNDNFDLEFNIPFDDDTEVNEAEITIYNLSPATVCNLYKKAPISVQAGYGKDVGIIFSGYISHHKTYWDSDHGRVTVIHALDNDGKKETELKSVTYGANSKASNILKNLVQELGLPIAVFEVRRDYTYKDKVTVSGGRLDNIKKFAQICGVRAYICKGSVYVCPLTWGTHDTFTLTVDTGLLSASEFEEESSSDEYTETITGQSIEMLLQHKVTTGSIINLTSMNAKGEFRVREGTHTYDGNSFKTTVKAIAYSCLKK